MKKLGGAALTAAMLAAVIFIAVPRAVASAAGGARPAPAPASGAPASAPARCLRVDQLAVTGSDATAAIRGRAPAHAEPPGPALTRLCVPVPAAVAGHGAGRPSAGPATRAINGYKTVGKFFVQVLTFRFNCTAAVIGRNIIVTAAHCFIGRISGVNYVTTGWMFAPMWHDNQFPYGKWYVHSVYLARNWISTLDPKFDFAVVVLNRRGGRSVGSYTGQDSWNSKLVLKPGQSTPVRVVAIPGASSKALISVTRAVAVQASRRLEVLKASTPGFGNGASGGPWFYPFNTKTDTGTIIGVTGGYQDGGATDSPSYADFLTGHFSDLMAAAIKGITHCDKTGACRYWPPPPSAAG